MTVFTIGHSTRTLEEFVALLREFGVACVADVRRFPGSRRHPHFHGHALAKGLEAAGIGYVHMPDLGGRRAPRPDSPNTAWQNAGFRAYADHMATPAFRDALDRLLSQAEAATVAVMCAEAVPWRCHRNLLSDAIVARGHDVMHILGPGDARPHLLHETARIRNDGTLEYPGGDSQLGLL